MSYRRWSSTPLRSKRQEKMVRLDSRGMLKKSIPHSMQRPKEVTTVMVRFSSLKETANSSTAVSPVL